jgi:phage terminase large subunit-like protein
MTASERFKQLKERYYYDAAAADEKIHFIEKYCTHIEGDLAGQPLIFPDVYKDEILRPIFGLKKPNGKRLIQEVYIQMPRKNAKTTLCAGVQNAILFNDGEAAAQIYNCAGDDEQAGLLFRVTKLMVKNNQTLHENSKTFQNTITYKESFIKKITSKSDTKHGFNTHGAVYDELHVAPNRNLYDTIKTSTVQRSNPIFIQITTPGFDRESICYSQYNRSKKVLAGIIEDDSFWCVIYESDDTDNIYSEAVWRKANPLYDHSENLREYLKNEAARARTDISYENTFRRLHLGMWTSSETKWIKDEDWTGLAAPVYLADYTDWPAWRGLDLSSTQDITSACTLFIEEDNTLVPFWDIWIPEDRALEDERRYNIPYTRWAKEGFITLVPGNTIDYSIVESTIVQSNRVNATKMLGYDPWNSIDMVLRLGTVHGIPCNKSKQGYSLNLALKRIKTNILNGKLKHNGNPVVRWMLDNVAVKTNDELYIKAVKPKNEKKIDCIISLAMAVQEYMTKELELAGNDAKIEVW